MFRSKFALLSFFCLFLCFASPSPASDSKALNTAMSDAQYQSYLGQARMWQARLAAGDEKNFYPFFYATGVMNRTFLVLFRFQPDNTETLNLHERHMTILFDSNSDLIGMVRTKPEWDGMPRVDGQTASERSAAFIWNYAPELFRYVESPDIIDYDIQTKKNNGEQLVIRGTLVRYTNMKRKNCFFVIVAPDKSVMAFERNVVWDSQRDRRQYESFLYDDWLEKHGYHGY